MLVTNARDSIDLKSLAYELLREAQQQLQEQGHLTPTAVVITSGENLIFEVEYEGDEEREEIYAQMVEVALEKNALAIITVNDVYLDDSGPGPNLEGRGWESFREKATEAIMITISGGGFETYTVVAPYLRRGKQLVFQPAQEKRNAGAEVELLGDWTGQTGAA